MQFMMGPCPRSYIPSFMQIGPAVPKKKVFEGFLPYMGMAAILVMCLFEVLRPSQPMGSCRARSVYLTTRLLGRLNPLSR